MSYIIDFIQYSIIFAPDPVVRVSRETIGSEGPDPGASRHPVKLDLEPFSHQSLNDVSCVTPLQHVSQLTTTKKQHSFLKKILVFPPCVPLIIMRKSKLNQSQIKEVG